MPDKKMPSRNHNSFVIPRYVITFGKVLQFFSENAATLFVAKLFSTPVKVKVPDRELTMRNSAKNESLYLTVCKKEINIYIYGYSKKKVLIVHGWAGRGTQLFQIADKVLENRMMVVSFDGPAHGLSSGKMTNMMEFLEAINEVNKKYGAFEAAIGHSFGGMALINAVANGLKVSKLVTIGADNSIPQIFKYFVKKVELKPEIEKRLIALSEKKLSTSLDEISSKNKAEKIDIPTLIIHDSEDKYVDVRSAVEIRQSLKKGELLITNGLGHHKIFKDGFVIQRIIDFIK
ncbi:alpha/beta hydrolase [Lutimonas zeaxanthinifaciens]|uniref:alpha/beta hydrolase n=1 Tax=Lutimonas zeaxanthinifaciens TaxID=3060215 RepID=UPI00265C9F0B|nr:alpha/beta hydrolase [Lutimonas sp. YSD2104]WKK65052.1 alpha/beta hydrolase [Lutimonas sp. YSD2104]